MTTEEFRDKVKNTIPDSSSAAFSNVYFVKRDKWVQRFDIYTDAQKNIASEMCETIHEEFLLDELDSYSNIGASTAKLYEYPLSESKTLSQMLSEVPTAAQGDYDAYNDADGLLFRFCYGTSEVWAYQKLYPMRKLKKKATILTEVRGCFQEVNSKIISVDARVDFLILDNAVVSPAKNVLEREFGYKEAIVRRARAVVEQEIRHKELLDAKSEKYFMTFLQEESFAFVRKVVAAKNSPVLRMSKDDLLTKLASHSKYKGLKVVNEQISISSKTSAKMFMKMINDDILVSEISGAEYESDAKQLINR